MPAPECGTSTVPGDGLRDIRSVESEGGTAQAEIDILQIRFEAFIQEAGLTEEFGAKESGRPRWRKNGVWGGKCRSVGTPAAGPPRGGTAANKVERAINTGGIRAA